MSPAVHRVRLRLLPWRVRRRVKGLDEPFTGAGDLGRLGDDPISAVLGLLVLLLMVVLVVLPFTVGLLLLPLELALVALVGGAAMLPRLLRLRPWVVVVEQQVGKRWVQVREERVTGLGAARAHRDDVRRQLAAG